MVVIFITTIIRFYHINGFAYESFLDEKMY